MQILFVLSTFLYQVYDVKASGGCRNLDFLGCIKNKAFVNHTIHTSNVLSPGLEQCQHECFMNGACVSYNLGPTRGMMRTCELSNTDHVVQPNRVVVKEGFEYCPIKNPCVSSPCSATEICKPDFSWDSFTCIDKAIACRELTQCPIYKTCVVQPVTKALECQENFSANCTRPLGMENRRIPDSAITASSVHTVTVLVLTYTADAHFARLHNTKSGILNTVGYTPSAWSSRAGVSAGEHLQVDLGGVFYITKVATQGTSERDNWVKTYSLKYSYDASTWADYLDNDTGLVKNFQGNVDGDTVLEHVFSPDPIKARLIRFVFLAWEKDFISMRLELYGCKS